MKIAFVLGTRPEIIKMSPVIRQCVDRKIDHFLIHSNQHYSENMDAIFFQELNLEAPRYNLNVGSGQHGEMIAKIITGVEKILQDELPNWLLVQGDTNTVMAGALAASKLGVKIGHIEAGLRSYDRTMPEEINRVVTDHISDMLFPPTGKQANILIGEGIGTDKMVVTGNTIVDAVLQNQLLLSEHPKLAHYQNEKYFLFTTHRPANVDSQENLSEIIKAISEISDRYSTPVYFPIHPRTKKQIGTFGLSLNPTTFNVMDPVGYLEMLALEKNSQLIFTDSGGIQEEACILGIPSLTLRDNTERPETIEVGASILVGHDTQKIVFGATQMLASKSTWKNPFGDGTAGAKIVKTIS